MVRTGLTALFLLSLAGCAQIFDANAFSSFDSPPALDATALGKASLADIQAMAADPSFYTALKASPTALSAVQTNLSSNFTNALVTGTSAEKTTAISAGTTYVLTTAFSTNAGPVAQNAVLQAANLVSGTAADTKTAMQNLFSGQSAAQIQATLDQFISISNAVTQMQKAATSGTTVDATALLGSSPSGDFMQTALVAGAVAALVSTNTSTATLAAAIASGGSISNPPANFTNALGASSSPNPATNPYAYLYSIKAKLF